MHATTCWKPAQQLNTNCTKLPNADSVRLREVATPRNFCKLALGCIEVNLYNQNDVGKLLPRSCAPLQNQDKHSSISANVCHFHEL